MLSYLASSVRIGRGAVSNSTRSHDCPAASSALVEVVPARLPDCFRTIRRTPDSEVSSIQHMRINHRGTHVPMTQQLLNCPNVVSALEQMRREGMPKRMTSDSACNRRSLYCLTNGTLDCRIVQMMSHHLAGGGITIETRRRKHPLPAPLAPRRRRFPVKCTRRRHEAATGREFAHMMRLERIEMWEQQLAGRVGEHRESIMHNTQQPERGWHESRMPTHPGIGITTSLQSESLYPYPPFRRLLTDACAARPIDPERSNSSIFPTSPCDAVAGVDPCFFPVVLPRPVGFTASFGSSSIFPGKVGAFFFGFLTGIRVGLLSGFLFFAPIYPGLRKGYIS